MRKNPDYIQLHYELCKLAQSYNNVEVSFLANSPESLAIARAAMCFDLIHKFFIEENNCSYLPIEVLQDQICQEESRICKDFKITNTEDFLHEVYNYSFPPDFQRSFPKYNPNNILVFAWSGALKVEKNNKNLELGDLKWVNKSLKDKLYSIADETNIRKYRTFFEKREGITIEDFFNSYLSYNISENLENQQVEIIVYLELLKIIATHFTQLSKINFTPYNYL